MALLGAAIALFAYTKIIEKPSGSHLQRIVPGLKSGMQSISYITYNTGGTDRFYLCS